MLDGTLAVDVQPDAVEFTFTVENAGTEPVDLEFHSGKVADVAVYSEGEEVWRWSDGRMFTQAIERETLAPGESLTREVTWEGPPPGAYTAEASLDATDASVTVRDPFEVA